MLILRGLGFGAVFFRIFAPRFGKDLVLYGFAGEIPVVGVIAIARSPAFVGSHIERCPVTSENKFEAMLRLPLATAVTVEAHNIALFVQEHLDLTQCQLPPYIV